MRRRPGQPLGNRKARDRAGILPLIGAILLLPPVALIFRIDAAVGGVPLVHGYLFIVWAALIAGAAALAGPLGRASSAEEVREEDAAEPGGAGETG